VLQIRPQVSQRLLEEEFHCQRNFSLRLHVGYALVEEIRHHLTNNRGSVCVPPCLPLVPSTFPCGLLSAVARAALIVAPHMIHALLVMDSNKVSNLSMMREESD
jgi:hypothetical protein